LPVDSSGAHRQLPDESAATSTKTDEQESGALHLVLATVITSVEQSSRTSHEEMIDEAAA
jgi:hypothetical protein